MLQAWHPSLDRSRLLKRLRNLLALMPLDDTLQTAGMALLRGLNDSCLASLDSHLADSREGLVIVVTGCRPRAARLLQTIRRFATASPDTAVIGVVGDPTLRDWELRFDPRTAVLSLPVSDAYEALPLKVGWAVLAVALGGEGRSVLKVDDDAAPGDLDRCVELLTALKRDGQAAAGYPITTATPLSLDRGWHIGKSSAPANRIAFNTIATRNWMSGGAGYLLSARGVAIVASHALHSWGFFETMLYEDITISMVLNATEADLRWLDDPEQLGIRSERADEIAQGLWPYDEAMLTQPPC